MKSLTRISMLMVTLACFFVLSSCGDDEKPANEFKVDGHSLKLSHAYMLSISGVVEEEEVSQHIIILTTEDLTYDVDTDEFVGTGDFVISAVGSQGLTLQKGTYELGDDEFEDLVFSYIGIGVEDDEVTEAIYYPTSGNMKVSAISSSKITLKFDFDEYDFETPDDDGSKEEDIKGYYSGSIEITEQEGGAKVAQKVQSLIRKR